MIFSIILLINLVNALSSEFIITCGGGGEETILGCLGDNFFWIGRDFIAPTINLENPIDGSEDTDGVVDFQYNVSDANVVDNCSLYLDGVLEDTDVTITEDTTQTFTVINPPISDTLEWYVNCTDEFGNVGNSSVWILDTRIGGGGPGGGAGGGGFGINTSLLCNLTYNSSLRIIDKYIEVEDIRTKYFNLTNNYIINSTIKYYIDNWIDLCEEPEISEVMEEVDYSWVWFVVLFALICGLAYLLIYKKKKILILLGWDED